MEREIILASASPRRRELMGYTQLPFTVEVADVQEVQTGSPEEIVVRNAQLKERAVAALHEARVILAADTVVAINGMVLGKPADEKDAVRMLRMLQNTWHEVHTGVSLLSDKGEQLAHEVSRVHFCAISSEAIKRYVKTGEPMDKAGAYALQGIGGMFVDRIEGSYSNVIGLPMARVRELLIGAGYDI